MSRIRSPSGNDSCISQQFGSSFDLHRHETGTSYCPVNDKCFESISVLGTGGYGKVVLVRKLSGPDSGRLYAMKILTKHAVMQKAKMVEHVLTERKVLEAVARSRFLVTLHYAFQSESKLHLVMDFVCGGELFTHLQRKRKFNENVVRFYMAEIILALGHLHGLRVIYRDLKLENVMLDSRGHIVLTDFGLSKIFSVEDKVCRTFSFCGTIEYMAPEIINVDSKGYTFSVDWWSLGVLSYELISGKSPFALGSDKDSHMDVVDRVVNAKLPSFVGINQILKDLLCRLMEKNPKRRIGCSGPMQICRHAFFKSVDWERLYDLKVPAPLVPTVKCEADTRNFLKEFTKQPITDHLPCPIPSSGQLFLDFDYEASLFDGSSALFTSDRPRTNHMRLVMNSSPFFKTYDLIDERGYLGEGTNTTCRRCVHRSGGKCFAVKIVPLKHFRQEETENLCRLQRHPLIVHVVEVLYDKAFVYIVMEPLGGGDLLQRIYRDHEFRLKYAKQIISNVVSVVRFMHTCSVVHGNLRPEKLLFTGDDTFSMRVVGYRNSQNTLADDAKFRSRYGSHAAAAIGQCRKMLESVDWWAVGLILYVVIYGRAPPLNQYQSSLTLDGSLSSEAEKHKMLRQLDAILLGLLSTNWEMRACAWDHLVEGEWFSVAMLIERTDIVPNVLDFEECKQIKEICTAYLGCRGLLISNLQPEVQSLISPLPQLHEKSMQTKPSPLISTAVATRLAKRRCRRRRTSLAQNGLKQTKGAKNKKKDILPAPSIHTMKLRSSSKKRNGRTTDNFPVVCLL